MFNYYIRAKIKKHFKTKASFVRSLLYGTEKCKLPVDYEICPELSKFRGFLLFKDWLPKCIGNFIY